MKRNDTSFMLYLYCRQCTPNIQQISQNSEACQNQNLASLASINLYYIQTKDILEVKLTKHSDPVTRFEENELNYM
jgi:hypothetical protein